MTTTNTLAFSINYIGSDLSNDTCESNVDYKTEIMKRNIIHGNMLCNTREFDFIPETCLGVYQS